MKKLKQLLIVSVILSSPFLVSNSAIGAQGLDLNSDNYSFLEEPIAFEVGNATVFLNSLIDLSSEKDTDLDESDSDVLGAFQLTAEQQLANALTIGATYFGEYDNENYEDEAAIYVRGIWGGLTYGDVVSLTRNTTKRMDGTGNADLTLDDFYASLNGQGIAYFGRYSAYTVTTTFDEDSNFDLGATFERPIGNKDYRFTLRYLDSEYTAPSGTLFNTTGGAFVTELIYGSLLSDISIGFENLESSSNSLRRNYISAGLLYKKNRWSFSLEGHVGEIEEQDENGYALGIRYDIARGLSANFGYNKIDSDITTADGQLFLDNTNKYIFSLRYQF